MKAADHNSMFQRIPDLKVTLVKHCYSENSVNLDFKKTFVLTDVTYGDGKIG